MTSKQSRSALIAGAGIFGLTAALELRRRGWFVTVIDPGPVPHPLAASTDISKVVRMEYGSDELYTSLAERSIAGWRELNRQWGIELYHETGVLFVSQSVMKPGSYEYESYRLLKERGHPVQRMDSDAIWRRFPAWNSQIYVDGCLNPLGGWAESGRVVERLAKDLVKLGGRLLTGMSFAALTRESHRVTGLRTSDGEELKADHVVLAMGPWSRHIVPELSGAFRSPGMPVFHLKPRKPELFTSDRFPVFGADTSVTGYYGFPLHPSGVLKIANHGAGREMTPDSPERRVTEDEVRSLRNFLSVTFPDLADAELVSSRVCLYCDSADGHFWITPHPELDGLTIASGGSGHGFKFAPVLGELIADAVENLPNPALERFRWRSSAGALRGDAARKI